VNLCIPIDVLCVTERPAVCVDANETLLSAIRRLRDNHVHRVLVIDSDTGNAVHVLTQRNILEFIASRVRISLSLSLCLCTTALLILLPKTMTEVARGLLLRPDKRMFQFHRLRLRSKFETVLSFRVHDMK